MQDRSDPHPATGATSGDHGRRREPLSARVPDAASPSRSRSTPPRPARSVGPTRFSTEARATLPRAAAFPARTRRGRRREHWCQRTWGRSCSSSREG
jgi:hypothetical protein